MWRGSYQLSRFAAITALGLTFFSASAHAVKLKPFDTPPPSVDPAKIALLPPQTRIDLNYDEILMVGTKGYVIMKIGPKNPIPPDVAPASPGIELRLLGYRTPDGLKPVEFMTRVSGEVRQVAAYFVLFADKDRLAACGYYIRKDSQPFAADYFTDLRSYIDVGGVFRLPTSFLLDETAAPKRPDGKIPARCVDTNIEWNPAYFGLPLSLHLEPAPFAYEWQIENSAALSPTRQTLPPPKTAPSPSLVPTQRNPYD